MKTATIDVVTLAPVDSDGPHELFTVFVRQTSPGIWTAQCIRHDAHTSVMLGRTFQDRNERVALGRMMRWVEERYGEMNIAPESEVLQGARAAVSTRTDIATGAPSPDVKPLRKE